ncbi:MAG: SDR family oxidoreductase [Clostridia bacterium]|nr:SDR family oxidoreductase [Clostridia bacterium]
MRSMKTVLITGASRGIGREIALKFAGEGYNVVLNYNSSEKKAKELANQIEKCGVGCLVLKADVAIESEVKDMVDVALKQFGKIDVLVNNAGVALSKLFQLTTTDEIARVFGVNTFGVINCSKAVVPSMVSEKCGKIINISSIWGKVGASMETIYSASKGAVISFTMALAKELAPSGISVNCVCPGVIDTDMLLEYTEDDKKELKEQTPLNRLGTPQDVANAVYFLASDNATFITGQVITVDGGFAL